MVEAVKARDSHQPLNYRDKGGNRQVFGGEVVYKTGVSIKTERNNGAVGTNVTVVEEIPQVHRTILTVAQVIAMTDATTNGSEGSGILYTFPEGNILILGAVANLTLTRVGTAIGATAALVAALGSVAAAADATLTGTEANIVPSTVATMTAGIGAMNKESTAPVTLDGTNTPAVCRLNLAVPDADSSGNDSITATGTVQITWINLGDN